MKKTYKNPTLKVVNVKPAQFIALSGKSGDADPSKEVLGRGSRYSSWEEEDAAADYDE